MRAAPPRILTVFGITGLTGQTLARTAAGRGWVVRGFARPESAIPASLAGTKIVRGTFSDVAKVIEAAGGADAVCCVIGPRPPYTEAFCAPATAAIIRAMREVGVRRLVCQTGAMVGAGHRTTPFEWLARMVARRQPASADDRREQERLVQESGLDWTLVKPPRLTNGPARNAVKADPTLRVGMLSSISRADVAAFMLDAIERSEHLGSRIFVRG